MLVYDVATEMARRIVDESRQIGQRDCINLVLYQLVDDDCWVGLLHVWNSHDGRILVRSIADTQEHLTGWLQSSHTRI